MTDKAIASNKKLPLLNFNQRKKILNSINGITKILPQYDWCYSSNILKYKPDIMVYGDDWKKDEGGRILRNNALNALTKIGSKLIEIPYTKNISSNKTVEGFVKSEKKISIFRKIY